MAEAVSEQGLPSDRQQRRLRKHFNLAEQPMDPKSSEPAGPDENEDEHPFFRDPSILAKVNRHLRVASSDVGDRSGRAGTDDDQPQEPHALRSQ